MTEIPLLGSKAMLNSATLNSARNVIKNHLRVSEGEKVLIISDSTKLSVADVLSYAVIEGKGESSKDRQELSMSVIAPRDEGNREPPQCVAEAMRYADVILIPTKVSMTFTDAVERALCNARIGSMPGITEQIMINGGLRGSLLDIKQMTDKIADALLLVEEYRITSSNKTDIVFRRGGRQVFRDDGCLFEKGKLGNLPAGEACFAIVEDSASGVLVIDRMGEIVTNGVKLTIRNGHIAEVAGPDEHAFRKTLESARLANYQNPDVIAEFGIGTNPAAKYSECEVESEKMYGTVHFGIGGNAALPEGKSKIAFHHDGVILDARLEIDGRLVLDGRKFYV
jgi:leucyl aminopeptidase (aminopeptidase T)